MGRKKIERDLAWDCAVGRNIEAARRKAKLTAVGLAHALGISQQRLYWYESGAVSCPARLLNEIAGELCVAVTSLMPASQKTRCAG